MERCRQRHIKLNKDKMEFKLPQLSYVDHVIAAEGLKPDPAEAVAILNMPPSADKQGLRRSVEAVLQCDVSQQGLGACLMQYRQPVAYASRSLTETNCNYVQMEKEPLNIVSSQEV